MLVLSRKPNQTIVFPGLDIEIEVLKIKGNVVCLGITADKDIKIVREELIKNGRELSAEQIRNER